MRILFVLSATKPSAAETYSIALASAWYGRHESYWVGDRLHFGEPGLLVPLRHTLLLGPINVARVAWLVKKHRIDVLHAHGGASSRVASAAARLTGRPFITTYHHAPSDEPEAGPPVPGAMALAVSEAIADELVRRWKLPAARVRVLRSAVDLNHFVPSPRPIPNVRQLLVFGRYDRMGWGSVEFLLGALKTLAKRLPAAAYRFVGEMPDGRRQELARMAPILSAAITPSRIEILGQINDVATTLRNSDGIIGAGRPVLESLAGGRPAILLGRNGLLGLCAPEILPQALASHFADCLPTRDFRPGILEAALQDLLTLRRREELIRWGRSQMEQQMDSRLIARELERVYAAARA